MTATSPIDEIRANAAKLLDSLEPGAAISSIVLFPVDAQQEKAFLRHADVLTEATGQLPGCNVFAFHRGLAKAQGLEYLIYEDWETLREFRVQWDSRHLLDFQMSVGQFLAGPPDLRFFSGWREYRMNARRPGRAALLTLPLREGAMAMARLVDPAPWLRIFANALQQGIAEPSPCEKTRLEGKAQPVDMGKPKGNVSKMSSPIAVVPAVPIPAQAKEGWGPMPAVASRTFVPPAASSTITPPAASPTITPPSFAEVDISAAYPYEPHFVEVYGSRMHYITSGTGDPILFLHGNPTSSYLWRNVIPHLSKLGRCIAPDLIGYGLSDKPEIGYTWFEQARYLEGFIHRLGLENVTLVLHDHGSGLGFHYAMRYPRNVKAIAFFEAIVRPFPWDEFSSPDFRQIFKSFRTGDVGGEGWQLIVDQNMFIEKLLPQACGRPLTEQEMNRYRAPFVKPESRLPIWKLARETPIGNEPLAVWNAVADYSRKLGESDIPKLMLYAHPGALLTEQNVEWVKRNYRNLTSVDIGPGIHFLQESSPHRIGTEIAAWLEKVGLKEAIR